MERLLAPPLAQFRIRTNGVNWELAYAARFTEVAEELGRERGTLYKQLARLKEKLIDCIRVRLAQEGVG